MGSGEAAAVVLAKLEQFFKIQGNFDTLDLLLDKHRGRAAHMPSLRVLEHLVTNFSRQKGFDFKLPHADVPMHLYDAYQAELQRHGKVLFDVFAREDKHSTSKHTIASPSGDGRSLKTTPKQMNFVRWAIHNNVIEYARDNLLRIRDHLPKHVKETRANTALNKKRKRNTFQAPSKLHKGSFKLSFALPELPASPQHHPQNPDENSQLP